MNNYIRHGTSTIDYIVDAIEKHKLAPADQRKRLNLHGFKVGLGSLRLLTFARAYTQTGAIHCVGCGLPATFFSTDSFEGQTSAHLNLYGVNAKGEEVLFTHDHTLARGLGGEDSLSNTQVMCSPCNAKKAKGESKEATRRHNAEKEKLRKLIQEGIDSGPGRPTTKSDLDELKKIAKGEIE